MINAQQIYYKAHALDAVRLQGLGDFLEVLLRHSPVPSKIEAVVLATQWEAAALEWESIV